MMNNEMLPWEDPAMEEELPFGSAGSEQPVESGEREGIVIKFGRGLVEEPFTSKNGKELVEIKIPNRDPGDKLPWESFVVPVGFVRDNKFSKGVWMRLPADGTTRLSRSVISGQDAEGKNIWKRETREVSNKELKSMMEAYKERKPRQSEPER